jgi:hypothetical protein
MRRASERDSTQSGRRARSRWHQTCNSKHDEVIMKFFFFVVAVLLAACQSATSPGTPDGSRPGDNPDAAPGALVDATIPDATPSTVVDATIPDATPSPVVDATISDAAPDTVADATIPDAAPDTAPVTVSVSPLDGATGVERDAAISVTFSTDMAADTIDTSSFVVTRTGAPVAGSVTYDAATRTASFHPTAPLALLGDFAATITRDATDTGGTPLAHERTWSFTVRDGQWSSAALLFPDPLDQGTPAALVAVDAIGRANVIGKQDDGFYTVRFEPSTGWHAPEPFELAGTSARHLASSPAGEMLALSSRGTPTSMYVSRFVPGGGWGPAELLEDDDAHAHHVGAIARVAFDPSGAAIAVWDQYGDEGVRYVWARRFVPASGWGTPSQLGEGVNPFAVLDASGNATAAWMQPNAVNYDLVASRFEAGAGWSEPHLLEASAGRAWGVRLVSDAAGHVIAVWRQTDISVEPTREQVWTARWSDGSWSAPFELDTGDPADSPEIAGDAAGNAIVLWAEFRDGHLRGLARRYVAGSGWGPAELVEDAAASPQIAMDPTGNAIAIWIRGGTTVGDLWASRFTPDGGWSAAVRVDADEVGDSYFPRVAVDALGGAVLVWSRSIGPDESGAEQHLWRATFE